MLTTNSKEFIENWISPIQKMNIEVVELDDQGVTLRLPLAGNENHVGTIYAGTLFSLAEFVIGPVYYSLFDMGEFFPLVKTMSISYLRPAATDVTLELSFATIDNHRIARMTSENGKCDFIVETEIKDKKGRTVATTSGLYQMRLSVDHGRAEKGKHA